MKIYNVKISVLFVHELDEVCLLLGKPTTTNTPDFLKRHITNLPENKSFYCDIYNDDSPPP